MKKFLFIVVIVLLAVASGAISRCSSIKSENSRLQSNQQALLSDVELYQTEAGESAAKVQRLELTNKEFASQCADLKAQVEQLGIKNKYLQTLITTSAHTTLTIDTIVKDSIVYLPALAQLDTLKCFEYNDGWVKAQGCIDKSNRFTGSFESKDSLLIVAHRVPKRFLFIRWGCKAVELDIVSSNPHTQISHAKYVEFSKK
jgi:hypothetical protein